MPKGTPTTLTHAGNVTTAQKTRNVTSIPIRTEPPRPARPNSRGTPSRASNNSRGARASEDRTGRSFDDADDHLHWLSIPAIEVDAQSFQSVTLDSMQQQEMANLVERQRINAKNMRAKDKVGKVTGSSHSELSPLSSAHDMSNLTLQLERQITASTEGLSDITLESDDGVGSDRTTTAFYMHEKGSPSRESVAHRLKNMSDEELLYLDMYLKAERQRRLGLATQGMVGGVDLQAVEARKQIRRSKSGGSEAAFIATNSSRKYMSSPGMGMGLERKGSGELNLSMTSLRLHGSFEGQEPEDPEVRSLFSIQENSPITASTSAGAVSAHNSNTATSATLAMGSHTHQSSPFGGVRVLSSSRGSGALHPGEKMFDVPKMYYNSTPSPLTHTTPTPTQQLTSPTLPIPDNHPNHSSRPGSRPASGGLASLLQIHPNPNPTTAANTPNNNTTVNTLNMAKPQNSRLASSSSTSLTTAFSSIEKEEEPSSAPKAKKAAPGHRSNTSREFVFSPSCAFDDISLGSAKSLNSSRSSRTRVFGENGSVVDMISSPSSTFSKHHHNSSAGHNPNSSGPQLAGGVKKTVQTTATTSSAISAAAASESAKSKSKKN